MGFEVEKGKVKGDYKKFIECKQPNYIQMKEGTVGRFDRDDFDDIFDAEGYRAEEIQKQLEKKLFVTDDEVEKIFGIENINLDMNLFEFRNKLDSLNGIETTSYLKKLYNIGLKPRIVDCTKALIFVIGNLDEVYRMAKDFSTDISANAFHD